LDETPQQVRDRIDHFRQLAKALTNQRVKAALEEMIAELERRLQALQNGEAP
jgi:polyhydroxyalkanoate synthesis regulator phasin